MTVPKMVLVRITIGFVWILIALGFPVRMPTILILTGVSVEVTFQRP